MKKRVFSVLLAALLVLSLLPAGIFTAFADSITVTSSTTTMSGGNTYNVTSDVTVSERIMVDGEATLVLGAGTTLTASKGIHVSDGNKLTIRGSGALIATGESTYAGIGGNYSGGEIVIEGGTITATGGNYAAGIGGGQRSPSCQDITITGGTITATGGAYGGAGIGGGGNNNWAGNYASCGNITITGGTIVATGTDGGAGIGGGGTRSSGAGAGVAGTISLLGGNITANANGGGVGVGGGVSTANSSNSRTAQSVVIGAVSRLDSSGFRADSVSVADGVVLTDGTNEYSGVLTADQITAISGAALVPNIEYESFEIGGKTYNLYSNFTATAGTDGFSNQDKDKLVDNNMSTKYCAGKTSLYVEFHARLGFVPYGYILTTGDDTANYSGRNPKNWTIKAKVNENDDWTTLAVVTDDTVLQATNNTDYCFAIDYTGENAPDPALYRYFRFEVSAIQSGDTFQLTELRFYGKEYGVKYYEPKPATCTETGIAQACYVKTDGTCYADEECTQPLDASAVIIPTTAHTPVYHAAVPHTSSANGTIAHYECSVCHKYFSDQACTHELTAAQIVDYRNVTYLNASGVLTALNEPFTMISDQTVNWTNGWYVLMSDVTIENRINVTGTVNLVLMDGATLTSGAGISVTSGNAINIYAQSTGDNMGALSVTSTVVRRAALGGTEQSPDSGVISIYGGRITAVGTECAGAIGAGVRYDSGNVSSTVLGKCTVLIAGGNVTATGGGTGYGEGGAGIGGGTSVNFIGPDATGMTITITGGTVTAYGGASAAAIGCGRGIGSGEINISGGTVTAIGTVSSGSGLGTGGNRSPLKPTAINISGGTVTATGSLRGISGNLNMTGGQVTTNSIGADSSSYWGYSSTLTINFSGNSFLNCTGGISASTYNINGGTYLIEKNGTAYQATTDTIGGGGKITRFTGSFHSVKFYDRDNTLLHTQTVATGYTAQRPEDDPIQMGYRFVCWKKGSAEYNFSTPVTSDLSITAYYVTVPAISYLNENGVIVTTSAYSLLTDRDRTMNLPAGTYTIEDDVTIGGWLDLSANTVFILTNNHTLTVSGVSLGSNASLAIYQQAVSGNDVPGTLNSSGHVAFTSNPASSAKKIAVYGGTVIARGEHGGAALGGTEYNSANVLIAGGTVRATGDGGQGCAIGTGISSTGGSITITGGTVFADNAGYSGAGIGSGDFATGVQIVISGGVIRARGKSGGAGIGLCEKGNDTPNFSITITGGVITATSGESDKWVPAIGCGYGYDSGTITITGGQITVTDTGHTCGIGGNTTGGAARITLGTTNDTDFIYSPKFCGTISFANELKLKDVYPETIATASNIAGQTLVSASIQFYTVHFYDEDGTTLLDTQSIFPGETIRPVTMPDRSSEGKFAVGWLKNGAAYDGGAPVTESFDLVAAYGDAKYLNEERVLTTLTESCTAVNSGTTSWSDGWYVVQGVVTISGRINVSGTVNLILCDGAKLTASQGITVHRGNTLNIFSQSLGGGMGALIVPGAPDHAAGIGGYGENNSYSSDRDSSGPIRIYGGVITVTGGYSSAAIGGGYFNGITDVLIAGGIVTAYGGTNAYAIGNGSSTSSNYGSTIVIKGGTVNVPGTTYTSYGIGGNNSTIKLGYTDADKDSIYSFGYSGTITYLKSMKIDGSDPMIIAGSDNVAGCKLVASGIPNAFVTFVAEDGSTVLDTLEYLPGTVMNEADAPAAPMVFGKYFVEWRKSGVAFDFASELYGNITLTAYYNPVPVPAGSGTEDDPYLIYTTADWNKIADMVTLYKHTLAGGFIKLCSDNVTVTKMIGSSATKFAGTFDGDGHTLTLDIETTEMMTGPFAYVEGATIKNLRTVGTVRASAFHASGLVGASYGVTIINCRVSASILFATTMTTVHSGGFIGHALSAPFTMTGCLFDGEIGYNGTSNNTMTNVGGLVGWDDASSPTITDCVNAGTFANPGAIAPIARVSGRGTITNCYTFVSSSCSGSNNDKRGAFARSISCTEDVTAEVTPVTTYSVAGFSALEHGIIYNGTTYAGSGESVTIDLTYTGDYSLLPSNAYPYFSPSAGTLTQVSGATHTLVMPGSDVTIGFRPGIKYHVYFNGFDPSLGTFTLSSDFVEVGFTVTVMIIPDNGILESVGFDTVEVTRVNDTTWTFEMPESDVTITPVFRAHTLQGSGTEADPYLIGSVDDWIVFAQKVNAGQTGAHAKMIADIDGDDFVSVMVGTNQNKFAGVFNGNGHTLRFCKEVTEQDVAPFRYASGARFAFLHVTGSISTSAKFAAGIVAQATDCSFYGCWSSIEISSTVEGDGTHGGLVGVGGGTLTLKNNRFDGKLLGETTTHCAGFIGWLSGTADFCNNYYAPTEFTMSEEGFRTIARASNESNAIRVNSNNWYTTAVNTQNANEKGDRTEAEMVDALGSGWTLMNDLAVPSIEVNDLSRAELTVTQPQILYTGTPAEFPYYVTLLDGSVRTEGFTVTYDPSAPVNVGFYTMTVTGAGYTGSLTGTVEITLHDPQLLWDDEIGWYVLQPSSGTKHVYLNNEANGFSISVFDSGGPNGNYNNYQDCTIVIHAGNGAVLTVSGNGKLESPSYDWVRVYDSDLSTILGSSKYSNEFTMDTLTSTDEALGIQLKSDGSYNYWGFKLTVTKVTTAVPGDVNNDGAVDILDVSALLNVLSGADASECGECDIDGDGSIGITDVSALLNILSDAGNA